MSVRGIAHVSGSTCFVASVYPRCGVGLCVFPVSIRYFVFPGRLQTVANHLNYTADHIAPGGVFSAREQKARILSESFTPQQGKATTRH